ncbi:uncharacterized protein LOC142319908 [Lycorma delicatula]|uniref:uncharacterized protein LOC142319908 n=1 Tax=Lycorma delicatula TaxID=130591 RepID=UPI003F50F368
MAKITERAKTSVAKLGQLMENHRGPKASKRRLILQVTLSIIFYAVLPGLSRRIEDSDIEIICDFLTNRSKVICVDLCYNNVTDAGITYLAEFLKGGILISELLRVNKTLTHLDLGETDQTVRSVVHLAFIISENQMLKHIDISRVIGASYHSLDVEHIVQVLCQMLMVNRTLTELHLEKLEINDFVLELLTEALTSNNTLLMLDLACNQIGDMGIEHISNFLKKQPPLQALMLNHNRIRNSGARCLSEAVTSRLRFLDIAHNNIHDDGVINIIISARKEYNLLVLFLWGNKITVKTAAVLENMLGLGVLKETSLDIKVYRDNFNDLQMAYNSQADLYKQRYYSVIPRKRQKYEEQLDSKEISFKYHNDIPTT